MLLDANLPRYVKRSYEIVPENNGSTATASMVLYFKQAEFKEYNTVNANIRHLLPDTDDPDMSANIANIRIRKVSGGAETTITPQFAFWNAFAERWEVGFDITGFSKFYVFTEPKAPLPLKLISFTAKAESCIAHIFWTTAEESGVSHFELEQSTDGTSWAPASTIPARNITGENKYELQININAALNFYRLKMVDRDGTVTYSKIIRLNAPAGCSDQPIRLYPNPVREILYLENVHAGDLFNIYDNTGRLVMQGRITKALQDISATRLITGTYTISIVNRNCELKAIRFMKK